MPRSRSCSGGSEAQRYLTHIVIPAFAGMTINGGKGVSAPHYWKPIGAAALALVWLAALLLGGTNSVFDPALLSLLYAADHTTLARIAIILTQLGGWAVLLLAALIAVVFLLLQRRYLDALLLLFITQGGRLMGEAQKALVARARPEEPHLVTVHSLSFPSAHAGNSMITWLTLAILLSGSRLSVAAALALSLLVGLTRPILGVHWPSDVIAGWAFGLLWTILLTRLRSPVPNPPRMY